MLGSLPSSDPLQRCRWRDCREQSLYPTAEDLVPAKGHGQVPSTLPRGEKGKEYDARALLSEDRERFLVHISDPANSVTVMHRHRATEKRKELDFVLAKHWRVIACRCLMLMLRRR